MKNFDEEEKQVQEICNRVKNANFIEAELKLALYEINKIVRKAYSDGYDDGMKTYGYIQEKNQEFINNLFKR